MIRLNKSHPDFNMAMEILCSVPPSPGHVHEALLAKDLGITVKELWRHIDRLKTRTAGFRINGTIDGDLSYAANRHTGVRVKCWEYWARVNGGKR